MKLFTACCTVLFCLSGPSLQASDTFDPRSYHQANCTGCHDTTVYTRKKKRVTSLAGLESQVRMCDANLGKKLFDDDIISLTRYLNEQFYHFPN